MKRSKATWRAVRLNDVNKEFPLARIETWLRLLSLFAVLTLSLLLTGIADAQTGQGIISGVVTDQTSASVPKAAVAIRNTDTNVTINATTNETGYYEVTDLNPGPYEVSVVAAGFKKFLRSGIVLLAEGHPSIDVTLTVGSANQTVVITEAGPLIDRQSVSIGQVLTSEEMSALPNGQTPIWLAMLSPGVQANFAQNYMTGGADPSWNGNGHEFGSYGRMGANEFSLDGAPNAGNPRGQAINLSPEEVGETSVHITEFDPSVGHTYGVSVTQTTKGGTNDLHGGLRYRRFDLRMSALHHFQRLDYLNRVNNYNSACATSPQSSICLRGKPANPWPGNHLNYSDAAIGGPVFIPKLFNGRDRLFFFVGVTIEAPNEASPETATVPTALEKKGDFSDLATGTVPAAGSPVADLFRQAGCAPGTLYYGQSQIYNPYTRAANDTPGHASRLPFCGNIIPQNLISTLPLVGIVNSALPDPAPGTNEYRYASARYNTYRAVTNRYDYAATKADHFFLRWTRGHYTKTEQQFLNNGLGDQSEHRWVTTGALGWSHILSPKTVVDATVGATQYTSTGFNFPGLQKYKPSALGFPTYLDEYAGKFAQFPIIHINSYREIGNSHLEFKHYRSLAIRGNLTSVRGNHTFRAGGEWRKQNIGGGGPQTWKGTGPSGEFDFDNYYVRQNNDNTDPNFRASTDTGLSYASFLLGLQHQSQTIFIPSTSRTNPYYSFYVGDTWRVSRKLTVVPGLRYEFEYGPTEKSNRQIVGWDPEARLTFAPLAETEYQKTLASLAAGTLPAKYGTPAEQAQRRAVLPDSLLPALKGGPIYAGVNGASTRQWVNNWRFLPRLGVAYLIKPNTVLRAGAGYFYDSLNVLNESQTINSTGFGTSTGPLQSSTDFGRDFKAGTSPLSDPFPLTNGARFVPAVGNSLGADYYRDEWNGGLGIYDHNRVPARSARLQVSLEHQFGASTMIQVAYVSSLTSHITLDADRNDTHSLSSGFIRATAVPAKFFTGGTQPNSATNALLSSTVPNPFYLKNPSMISLKTSNPVYYNLLSKSGYLNDPNIQIANLVRPYPQLRQLDLYESIGTSRFHEFQANFSHRSRGLITNVSFQKNYQKDRDYFENTFDTTPSLESSWRSSAPWRITGSWVYTLPFGRGQKYAQNGLGSALFGGFRLSGSFEASPGRLLTFSSNGSGENPSNIFFIGDPNSIRLTQGVSNVVGNIPYPYAFNAQAVTATYDPTTNICTYTGTGFVRPSSTIDTASNTTTSACQPTPYNLRVFPVHVEGVRDRGISNWNVNIGRTFNPRDRVKVEIRADFNNVFNHQRLRMDGASMNPDLPVNRQFGQTTRDGDGRGREMIFQLLTTF
jgi:hypothetical protein